MNQIFIDKIKNSKDIREYIVNCYLFCFKHFAQIHDHCYNNDEDLIKRSSELLEENLIKNKNKFSYHDLPIPEHYIQALINLYTIDDIILDKNQSIYKSCFNSPKEIFCPIDNENYFILKKPANPIDFHVLDTKKIRRTEDRPKDLSGVFSNFIIAKSSINGMKCEIQKLPSQINNLINLSVERKDLNIAAFSNYNIPDYQIQDICTVKGRTNIFVDKVINEIDIINEITNILSFSYDNNISIIVLPELFIYSDSRKHIQSWLRTNNRPSRILLVIAGSMHNSSILNNKTEYYNESVVFDNFGEIIWNQRKFDPFINIDTNQVEHFDYENKSIKIVDSSLGRILLSICIDFKSDTYSLSNKEFNVNINFIPAWTDKTDEFREKSIDHGSNFLSSTFCANNTVTSRNKTDKGFIYLPSKTGLRGIYNQFTQDDNLKINFLKINVLNFTNVI